MTLHKPFALTLALLGVLGITAATANADTISKGTFTLPAQAYWNSTLLQPGDYTVAIERTPGGVDLVRLRGEGTDTVFLTPAGALDGTSKNCLQIDDLNGAYVIREFDAGVVGRSYRFPVSKKVSNGALRGAVRNPVTIPVATASGM